MLASSLRRTRSKPKLYSGFSRAPCRAVVSGQWFWASAGIAASLLVMFAWRTSSDDFITIAPRNRRRCRGGSKLVELIQWFPRRVHILSQRFARNVRRIGSKAASAPRRRGRGIYLAFLMRPSSIRLTVGRLVRIKHARGFGTRSWVSSDALDRVQAEVLLGGDGVARAIRLVSNSGLNSEGKVNRMRIFVPVLAGVSVIASGAMAQDVEKEIQHEDKVRVERDVLNFVSPKDNVVYERNTIGAGPKFGAVHFSRGNYSRKDRQERSLFRRGGYRDHSNAG